MLGLGVGLGIMLGLGLELLICNQSINQSVYF